MNFSRIVFVFTLLLHVSVLSAQSKIDVQHYEFRISLSDQSDSIAGMASIRVKFLADADELSLDLASLKNKKGMTCSGVTKDKQPLENTHREDKLTIRLRQTAKKGEEATFIVAYKGIPADGLIISKNKFGQRTFFGDNWPNRARNWLPCVDDPADKASVDFIVTAPLHYEVISNGVLIEETNTGDGSKLTHWREAVPLPTKIMVIGAADFAIQYTGEVNCIPVSSWVFNKAAADGFSDYAPAKDILSFMIGYIGPYPYKKLANVQSNTIFGGMENASAIYYFENSVNGRQDQLDLMAHEIAHQWFGDMATEKSFAHLWLSEGFATYLSILYMEKKYGVDSARSILEENRRKVISFVMKSDRPVVDSVTPTMSLLNANSYQKGGWVLHMLRNQLGDSVFRKCIRAYYTAYAGKNADTRDLQQVFEKTSGKNLDAFFRQWLYTPGVPLANIRWSYSAAKQQLTVTIKQLQQKPFQFPLELMVKTASGKNQVKTLQVSQLNQAFILPFKEKPTELITDPAMKLLFQGNVANVN